MPLREIEMKEYLLEAIEKEKTALNALSSMSLQECEEVMVKIEACRGKVVFCGVGKSAHIAAKLAATFASLGIPSFFVHATESMHGDLGMIEEQDIVILISNSGNTMEVLQVLTPLHSIGCTTVACCSNRESALAKACDLPLIYPKVTEADAYNLAPTSSTTLVLVLGDAIACAIAKKRGFNKQDFHKFHPGGSLGKQLAEVES